MNRKKTIVAALMLSLVFCLLFAVAPVMAIDTQSISDDTTENSRIAGDDITVSIQNNVWDGNGDIVITYNCPDNVSLLEARLFWSQDDNWIIRGINYDFSNKIVTFTEDGMRQFFYSREDAKTGGEGSILLSFYDKESQSNILKSCALTVKPLTIDSTWKDVDTQPYFEIKQLEASIMNKISSSPADTIGFYMTMYIPNRDSFILSKDVLNALKASKKTMTITFMGVESSPTYTWTFTGQQITTVSQDVHLVFSLPDSNSDISPLIEDGVGNAIFEFKHSGALPEGTAFTTILPYNQNFGETGWFYFYNEDEKILEYVEEFETEQATSEGFRQITLNLSHCSSYVLTNKKLAASQYVVYPTVVPDPEPVPTPDNAQGNQDVSKPNNVKTESVKTGDDHYLELYGMIFMLAGTSLLFYKKNTKYE